VSLETAILFQLWWPWIAVGLVVILAVGYAFMALASRFFEDDDE